MVELGFVYPDSACRSLGDGINVTKILICDIDQVINLWMTSFDSQPPNAILTDVWDRTKLPLPLLINETDTKPLNSTWKSLLTSQNICYQSKDMTGSTSFEFETESQYTNMNCSYLSPDTSCTWTSYYSKKMHVLLTVTASDYNPVVILSDSLDLWSIYPGSNCYRHLPCLEGINIRYTFRHLLDTPVDPCSSDPKYHQMDCIDECMLAQIALQKGCVPPYLQDNTLPECTVQDFREGKMDYELQTMTKARDICQEKCPTQCKRTFISVTPSFLVTGKQRSIIIRQDVSLHTRTEEELVWPLGRALCEIGGAMGLYLGLSFLSVLQSATILVMALATKALLFGKRLISKARRIKNRKESSPKSDFFYKPKLPPVNDTVPDKVMYIPPIIVPSSQLISGSKKAVYTVEEKSKQLNSLSWIDETSPNQKTSLTDSENGKWCRNHLWWMIAFIPCAVIFFPLAINQYLDYSTYPVFTSYETRYLEDVVFPSVTFCMWPPFHPHRLASAGVSYNFSHHCNKFWDSNITFKYNCDWDGVFNELLNDLPGNWTGDLETLWRNVAWKKSDLFRSIKFDSETYEISESFRESTKNNEKLPMKTVVTSLNRCFTFTSPRSRVTPHSELIIQLTNLKSQIMKRIRCYDPTYYWPMDGMFSPIWLEDCWSCYIYKFKLNIFVHAPHQIPLLADDGTYFPVALTSNTFGARLEVSLDAFNRLSTPSSPCVDARNITGGHRPSCIQQCLTRAAIKKVGCRLPFANWSSAPLCSREDYAIFPKYFNSPGEILQDPLEAKRQCEESCPQSCNLLYYSVNQGSAKLTDVSIAFQKPMFTQVSESWRYSSVQLLSNIGSLASLFLGISLYQILTCCLSPEEEEEEEAGLYDIAQLTNILPFLEEER
ncbi:uncharacterized protein [Palaemon carinicauda]|uniref:uncharacterized protein n=1 Tax=Palaemon carinicauda TaxID=392227 RepID=UPI0035B69D4E